MPATETTPPRRRLAVLLELLDITPAEFGARVGLSVPVVARLLREDAAVQADLLSRIEAVEDWRWAIGRWRASADSTETANAAVAAEGSPDGDDEPGLRRPRGRLRRSRFGNGAKPQGPRRGRSR